MRNLQRLLLSCVLLSGCVSVSGSRNGPPRNIQRDSLKVVSTENRGSTFVTKYQYNGTVPDASKPFGFSLGMKEGIALGGNQGTRDTGAAMDGFFQLTLGFWRVSVSPQVSAFMNIHLSEAEARSQLVLAVPVELELAFRPLDRMAITGAFGKSVFGFSSLTEAAANVSEDMSFLRGRAGLILVLSNGDEDRYERTLRLETFLTSGDGATLAYRSTGLLLTFDFIGTTKIVR